MIITKKLRLACVSTYIALQPVATYADIYAGIELPGVPVEITDPSKNTSSKKASSQSVPEARTSTPHRERSKKRVSELKKTSAASLRSGDNNPSSKLVIDAAPGVNTFIPISVGRLNRIVTPFETPMVIQRDTRTTTEVTGSTIYVATDSEQLVTMFVTDSEDDTALSLTLVPKKIPPTDVTLRLGNQAGGVPIAGARARKWEESQNYVDTIASVMEALATNRTPPGYSLRAPVKTDVPIACAQRGLSLRLGQVLDGHNLFVHVYEAANESDNVLEVNETACYQSAVTAVATWPNTLLEPRQKTELYVIFSRQLKEEQKQTRPSVIGAWSSQ